MRAILLSSWYWAFGPTFFEIAATSRHASFESFRPTPRLPKPLPLELPCRASPSSFPVTVQVSTPKMTVQSLAREKRSRRHIRAPLLPQKYDECNGHDSVTGAVLNLSTTIVGAGIMSLPATIRVLGLGPGIVMILLAAFLTDYSIGILLRFGRAGYAASSKVATANSYSGVVGDVFGGTGRTLSQTLIVINNLGMLVVYMIIIGDVLSGTSSDGTHHPGVLEGWFGQQWWTRRSFVLLLTVLLVFSPLISLKRLDSLRYTSALSVALAVVFVVITAAVAVVKLINGRVGMPRLLPEINDQASFWNLFSTVPVLVTAYICHYSIFPIENELKDPTKMKSIVRTSLVLCSIVYAATSFFGFILFGDDTLDDVLANFDTDLELPHSALINDVVRVSYAVHLMLVFPIVFFSLRLNLDGLLFPHAGPISFDSRRFFSLTVALMSLTFLGANYVPSIWDAFQFTGATATVSIGFIFPAAVALRDIYGIATKKDRILSWIMILLAVSSSTVALSSDIYGMFTDGEVE